MPSPSFILYIYSLRSSPLLENLVKKGYEVLLMVDPIDEYAMQNLVKYDSKYKLTNLGHEGVKFDDEEDDSQADHDEKFKPLMDYLTSHLSERIGRVKVSNRLTRSPCALVAESWGYTATMERIVKAQALSDPAATNTRTWVGRKVMEINPHHPIIIELNRLVKVSIILFYFFFPHIKKHQRHSHTPHTGTRKPQGGGRLRSAVVGVGCFDKRLRHR